MKRTLEEMLIKFNPLILAYIGLSFVALIILITLYSYTKTEELSIKVDAKEVTVKNQSSLFLIFTENETFEVADSIFTMNFKSSDSYNKIKENSCYDVKVRGIRIGLFSMFRNIEKFKEITCEGN